MSISVQTNANESIENSNGLNIEVLPRLEVSSF